MATVSARPLADTIRKRAEEDGIEFCFAQFVDMNAKPSAKLVPIENWEGLVNEGAGFAGFAAGPIGQTPARIRNHHRGHISPSPAPAGGAGSCAGSTATPCPRHRCRTRSAPGST